MTSRWYPEGGQHRMLTASVILQCICIVIVEAFNHNSIRKNTFSSQVLFTLTHSPSSLTSVSRISLPLSFCLTHSPPLSPPALPHSVPTLSYSPTLLTPVYSYSLICHSLSHPPASFTPFLTHSFTHPANSPASLTHSSLPCLIHSLFHSFSVSLTFLLLTSWLIRSGASFCLTHFLPHSLPCFTDVASLTPYSLLCLTNSSFTSHSHSLLTSFISFLIHSASICLTRSLPLFFPYLSHSLLIPLPPSLPHSLLVSLIFLPLYSITPSHCLTPSLPHWLPHLISTRSPGSLIYSLHCHTPSIISYLTNSSCLPHSLIHSLLHPLFATLTPWFTPLSYSLPCLTHSWLIHSVTILCLTLPASLLSYQWIVWSPL